MPDSADDDARASIATLSELQRSGDAAGAAAGYRKLLGEQDLGPRARVVVLTNLGTIEAAAGRLDDAVELYERALVLAPRETDLLYNLGSVLVHRGSHERAAEVLAEVCLQLPEDAGARLTLARCLRLTGQREDAVTHYRAALELAPSASAQRNLGNILGELGRADEALHAYRRAAALGDATAAHLVAAKEGAASAGAPAEYVRAVFDQHADGYDAALEALAYRGPELIERALAEDRAQSSGRALDLGCGTGRCGPMLRARCAELVGVDLSDKMLAKADALGLYDELVQADVVELLLRCPEASWDLIVAADVLVYLGDLTPLFGAVARGLSSGGRFVFTTERTEDAEHRLGPSGRYAHASDYLRRVADEVGLEVETLEQATLRREGDEDVSGFLVSMRRAAERAPSTEAPPVAED